MGIIQGVGGGSKFLHSVFDNVCLGVISIKRNAHIYTVICAGCLARRVSELTAFVLWVRN